MVLLGALSTTTTSKPSYLIPLSAARHAASMAGRSLEHTTTVRGSCQAPPLLSVHSSSPATAPPVPRGSAMPSRPRCSEIAVTQLHERNRRTRAGSSSPSGSRNSMKPRGIPCKRTRILPRS